MNQLDMQIRSVEEEQRIIEGIAVPYDQTTYLVPGGERIKRGAFLRSIQHKADKIPLCRGHEHDMVMGWSQAFMETDEGLEGHFRVNEGTEGDQLLQMVRQGYYPSMSVGFTVTRNGAKRAADGVTEITEAKLIEVSVVGVPAYENAAVLAVRSAQDLNSLLAPFQNIPKWDLDPLPPIHYSPRRVK